MKHSPIFAGIALVFLVVLGGCGKQSPYMTFGLPSVKQDSKTGKRAFVHYVQVQDPKNGNKPINDLGSENFEVVLNGKVIKPSVTPSTGNKDDNFAISAVIDQGTKNAQIWQRLTFALDQVAERTQLRKNRIGLITANGEYVDGAFVNQVELMKRKIKLKPIGGGHPYTFSAIQTASNPQTRNALPKHTKLAVIAFITGKPVPPVREPEKNVPIFIFDCANTNDPNLKSLAEKSGGQYIAVTTDNAVDAATNTVDRIARKFADTYAISFPVDNADVPNYTLKLKVGSINESSDYISQQWLMTLLVGAALILALLIGILAFVMRSRRAANRAAPIMQAPPMVPQAPMAPGTPMPGQIVGNFGLPGDSTTGSVSDPGIGRQRPGDETSGGYGSAAPPSYGSTVADSAYGGTNAGDMTIGGSSTVGSSTPYDPRRVGDSTVSEANPYAAAAGPYGTAGALQASAQLRIETGMAAGQNIEISVSTKVGRGDSFLSQRGTLLLPGDPKISREHCEIQLLNNAGYPEWSIHHKSTTNQTYVNDQPVQGMRRLSSGDAIRVGATVIRVLDLMDNATMR